MPRRQSRAGLELDAKLTLAAKHVAAQGVQLTPVRRAVLRLLYVERKAIGAYELVFKFQENAGRRIAPNTVYRALDFLVRHRLAAHIAGKRAFVALTPPETDARHASVFFTCNRCGRLIERCDVRIERLLRRTAAEIGFVPGTHTIEIAGTCADCNDAGRRL